MNELYKDFEFKLPYRYQPRFYQVPFLQAMDPPNAKKRACWIIHRRGGKTITMFNFAQKKTHERVGSYYHCFPEYGQGRKVIWDGIDGMGHKIVDYYIPKNIVASKNNTEMKINYKNGSIYQIIGADNYNSVLGSNPVGIIFDEYSLSDKYEEAWNFFRPILAENGGWAVFVYTPRGRNHGFRLYQQAMGNPDWFCEILPITKTNALTVEKIEEERRAGMPESLIQQEYYCSFVSSTEDIVIPYNLIQDALNRDVRYDHAPRIAGLDVARFGNDRTALLVRQGGNVSYAETWGHCDLVETAGRAIDRYKSGLYDIVAVDTIGVGAGVADILRANEIPTVMVQVSESAVDADRFVRSRDELWWNLRKWFEEGECSIPKSLNQQMRDDIVKDIQDIHYKYTPSGKIQIESKDEIKERLGLSPDLGDALCLTMSHKVKLHALKSKLRRKTQAGAVNWDRRGGAKGWDGSYIEITT